MFEIGCSLLLHLLAIDENPHGVNKKCVVIREAECSLRWPWTLQFILINMLFPIMEQ